MLSMILLVFSLTLCAERACWKINFFKRLSLLNEECDKISLTNPPPPKKNSLTFKLKLDQCLINKETQHEEKNHKFSIIPLPPPHPKLMTGIRPFQIVIFKWTKLSFSGRLKILFKKKHYSFLEPVPLISPKLLAIFDILNISENRPCQNPEMYISCHT